MKPDNPVYKKRDNRIEIADLISLYRSKWPAFLISIAACLALAVLYIYIKAPVYEIQANILITDDDKTSDLMRSISMADMFVNNTSVDEEMSILNSHSLFRNVTEKLGCNITYTVKNNLIKRTTKYSGSPVKLTPPAGIADTLRSSLKFKLRADKEGLVSVTARNSRNKVVGEVKDKRFPVTLPTPYGDFILSTTDKYEKDRSLSMQIGFCGYDLAAERLQKEVMCYIPNKKADVITVALNSTDINYAKSVVNAIVDQYNARGIEENQRKAQQTADFIDKRLVDISKELNDAESDIEQYKQSHDIVDVEVETKYLLTRKGTLEESLIAAETEVGVLELTRDFIADPANRFNLIPTPLGAEAAAEAIEAYNSLILERIRLEKSAKPGNKVLTALNEQIDAMRSNVATTLERSIASARVTLNELRGKSGDSQSRLGDIPAREREFVNIKRRQAVKENLYLFLLKERE
ncbi:Wzz/FepE/Etk N-terminal domain-containing protein, partial [uncultured Muribaculum sp.]